MVVGDFRNFQNTLADLMSSTINYLYMIENDYTF